MNKSYDKYYVKKNPATGYCLEDNGKPVLGELAKSDCRLQPNHVKILNRGWINSGIFYVEVKEEPKEEPKIIKDDKPIEDYSKLELQDKCRELGLDDAGNKPDLIERINNLNK